MSFVQGKHNISKCIRYMFGKESDFGLGLIFLFLLGLDEKVVRQWPMVSKDDRLDCFLLFHFMIVSVRGSGDWRLIYSVDRIGQKLVSFSVVRIPERFRRVTFRDRPYCSAFVTNNHDLTSEFLTCFTNKRG